MRRVAALSAAFAAAALTAPAAGAAVQIGPGQVVVTSGGARAVISRSPIGIEFFDRRGRRVLREVAPPQPAVPFPVAPVPQLEYASESPPPPSLYAPLAFLVGSHTVTQETAGGPWNGNLRAVTEGGVEYAATNVLAARRDGRGARLEVATSDPSGRLLVIRVLPGPVAGSLRVIARADPAAGVAAVSDSFASPAGEAFRGFGGRHNSIDQRGTEFYNWVQQQNVSSGSLTAATDPANGPGYLFPNGDHAAYYVQSSFVSPSRYGFLLARDEISHWRMASDRAGAWQTEVAAPAIDYIVVPGGTRRAVAGISAINGRHRMPPAWAVGPQMDRAVPFIAEGPAAYARAVRDDLRQVRRRRLPLDAYRIEGWQFLPRPVLRGLIRTMRARGIRPLLYFRLFVGRDDIGTDDPSDFDEAVNRGYVAERADGSPYVFITNFFQEGAVVDYTDRAALGWWKGRIREALALGAEGFMQDFGEQVQVDMHFEDGSTGATMHNRLAVLAHRATRQAIRAFERSHPQRRIFFFTRAGYSGTPGAAAYENANFPGDETTDWTHASGLGSLATDMLNRAVGGAYGYTTDIGGYWDFPPHRPADRELFLRWAEWAALSPLFRLHGSILDGVHTPWSYDRGVVRAYRRLSRLRLRARPLILRLWRTAVRTGIPPTRPMWLQFPGDRRAAAEDQQWMLGPNLLVAPVVAAGARSVRAYLPRGCWRSPAGRRLQGPGRRRVAAPLGRLPYFVRCGTRPLDRVGRAD